jgi:hypothetical protein
MDEDMTEALRAIVPPWIEKCGTAVQTYYGRFPVPLLHMTIGLSQGGGVEGGRAFPQKPPLIQAMIGERTTEAQLMEDDWVLVHEMIHLAFPYLERRHNWMAEGLAVYIESICRVQAGHLPPEQIWGDFVTSMPKGLPREGEGGFDQTRSWGRTYWGGALFCLLCDVGIRQQTDNRFGLQHALRAINAVSNFSDERPLRETLEIGDKATTRSVLIDTYDAMRETAVITDLTKLWQELGVVQGASGISFDDKAPLAAIRKEITRKMV